MLKQTGLSKKELQALDELGILQADSQKARGIRLYNEQTLMRIAQFAFYEALVVPLEVTREILANSGLQRPDAVLDAQLMLLYTKQDLLNTRLVCVEACQALDRVGKPVPWGTLTRLQHKLPGRDLNFWDHFQPDSTGEQRAFRSFDQLWSLYQTWKHVLISAAIFQQAGVLPDEPLARSVGLERLNWQREVESGGSDVEEIFNRLETTELWLQKPPFGKVFDWLAEAGKAL
ncbi:MAG: hypothetical protein WBI14_01825 [Anaerolineaceae bacterium]